MRTNYKIGVEYYKMHFISCKHTNRPEFKLAEFKTECTLHLKRHEREKERERDTHTQTDRQDRQTDRD